MADQSGAGRRLTAAAATACLAWRRWPAAPRCPPGARRCRSRSRPAAAARAPTIPQLIPAPPGKGWSPEQIVSGFLAASGSFVQHHAFARQYLAPQAARTWNPGQAVTVVSGEIQPKLVHQPKGKPEKATGQPAPNRKTSSVKVSGVQVASISASGQYQVASGPTPPYRVQPDAGQRAVADHSTRPTGCCSATPSSTASTSRATCTTSTRPAASWSLTRSSSRSRPPPPTWPPSWSAALRPAAARLAAGRHPDQPSPRAPGCWATVKIEGSGAVVNLGGTIIGASADTLRRWPHSWSGR